MISRTTTNGRGDEPSDEARHTDPQLEREQTRAPTPNRCGARTARSERGPPPELSVAWPMNDSHDGPVPPEVGRWCLANTRCTTFLSMSIPIRPAAQLPLPASFRVVSRCPRYQWLPTALSFVIPVERRVIVRAFSKTRTRACPASTRDRPSRHPRTTHQHPPATVLLLGAGAEGSWRTTTGP
jgi:hypothetical protein